VVGHDLQGEDFGLEIRRRLVDDPDEAVADRADEDLATPLGTPDQVVVDEKGAGLFAAIFLSGQMSATPGQSSDSNLRSLTDANISINQLREEPPMDQKPDRGAPP